MFNVITEAKIGDVIAIINEGEYVLLYERASDYWIKFASYYIYRGQRRFDGTERVFPSPNLMIAPTEIIVNLGTKTDYQTALMLCLI